jgi:hypothetical protein
LALAKSSVRLEAGTAPDALEVARTKEMSDGIAANRTAVTFEIIDGYLLGEPVSKADLVADLLAHRSADPAAAPFYRALEAVGVRAADEAFAAIRIVLGGGVPSDARVRRVRALSGLARAAANGERREIEKIFRRDAAVLEDLSAIELTPAPLGDAARRAYRLEFE